MHKRWKVLAVACALAIGMPSGAALAHDPEEFGGTPLTDPFGHKWSLGTHKEDLTPQEINKRAEEFFAHSARK